MMARAVRGQVIERNGKRGKSFAVRFQVAGVRHFVTLGGARDGWTRPKAEAELQNILADVRRGIWTPPSAVAAPMVAMDPTFWEFASEWFEANRHGWAENTVKDYRWQL